MKILFVCRQNIGRSQMAQAFYNQLTSTNDAESVGTTVELPGQMLAENKALSSSANWFLFDVMDEVGIDIRSNVRTQVDPEMLAKYDQIIAMAEPENTPDWLAKSSKYVYWEVEDPKDKGIETTRAVRDTIRQKIKELISLRRTD